MSSPGEAGAFHMQNSWRLLENIVILCHFYTWTVFFSRFWSQVGNNLQHISIYIAIYYIHIHIQIQNTKAWNLWNQQANKSKFTCVNPPRSDHLPAITHGATGTTPGELVRLDVCLRKPGKIQQTYSPKWWCIYIYYIYVYIVVKGVWRQPANRTVKPANRSRLSSPPPGSTVWRFHGFTAEPWNRGTVEPNRGTVELNRGTVEPWNRTVEPWNRTVEPWNRGTEPWNRGTVKPNRGTVEP